MFRKALERLRPPIEKTMKEFECALRFLEGNSRLFVRQLWRSYTAFAGAAGVLALGLARLFYYMFMPGLMLHGEGLPWQALAAVLPIDGFGVGLTLIGLCLFGWCALRAHRRTVRVTTDALAAAVGETTSESAPELTRSKRTALLTLALALGLLVVSVLVLPLLTLGLSLAVSALSGMMEEVLSVPTWSWAAVVVFSALGMLALQVFTLYLRLVFHVHHRQS